MAELAIRNFTQADKETLIVSISIVTAHNGQASFDLTETANILGYSQSRIGQVLKDSGILVKPSGEKGNGKRVSVYDIAEYMRRNKISPVQGRL